MSAKIQIKFDLVGTFGGIFLMVDHFNKVGFDKLVDKLLGNRRFDAKAFLFGHFQDPAGDLCHQQLVHRGFQADFRPDFRKISGLQAMQPRRPPQFVQRARHRVNRLSFGIGY